MGRQPLVQSIVAALAVGSVSMTSYAADWLQFGVDASHSSFNSSEHGYSTSGNATFISGTSIKTAGSSPSTKSVDSAPVLASGVLVGGTATDILYFVGKDGTLIAIDANTGNPIWSHATTATGGQPTTGSPAVDAAKQFVYAYALDGKVHKYNAATGTETTSGGWPVVSTLKPQWEKGASALAIATSGGKTFLYSVTDGYIGDQNDYQGHITAINLADASFKVFNTECSDITQHFDSSTNTSGSGQSNCASRQNGIWGRPGATFDSATNRIFISTGNGPFDPTNTHGNGINWGDSVLALNPDGSGSGTGGNPVDSYTPTTFPALQGTDADLGSASIAVVPSPAGTAAAYAHIGVQVGKDGCVRLINLADMSGQAKPGMTGGELDQKNLPGGTNCASGSDGPEIKPQPAVWVNPADGSSWVFVTSYNDGSAAYKVVLTAGKPSLAQQWTAVKGSSPVVANGQVYYMTGSSGGASNVVALDAITGATVWTGPAMTGVHWQSLIVVNGKVYLADNGSKLWAFTLDGVFKSKFD